MIDTHTFLWCIDGNPNLPEKAKAIIEHQDSKVYLSIISLWEIAIKESLNKLVLTKPFETLPGFIRINNIILLSIKVEHLLQLKSLPRYHKDPFDRLLI